MFWNQPFSVSCIGKYFGWFALNCRGYASLNLLTTKLVWLPGDQVSRRGALTGGYYDTRRSRLDLQKGKMEFIQQQQQQQREYEEHKAKLQNILLKLRTKLLPITFGDLCNIWLNVVFCVHCVTLTFSHVLKQRLIDSLQKCKDRKPKTIKTSNQHRATFYMFFIFNSC